MFLSDYIDKLKTNILLNKINKITKDYNFYSSITIKVKKLFKKYEIEEKINKYSNLYNIKDTKNLEDIIINHIINSIYFISNEKNIPKFKNKAELNLFFYTDADKILTNDLDIFIDDINKLKEINLLYKKLYKR